MMRRSVQENSEGERERKKEEQKQVNWERDLGSEL